MRLDISLAGILVIIDHSPQVSDLFLKVTILNFVALSGIVRASDADHPRARRR